MPEMFFVDSSNIEAIGYDSSQQQLHVQFKSGQTYVYYNVEESVFEEFKQAESKGKFLHAHIKGVYEYQKL